jgi:peptide/nickel transport system permease protein
VRPIRARDEHGMTGTLREDVTEPMGLPPEFVHPATGQGAWRRFMRSHLAVAGLVGTLLFIAVAVSGNALSPYSPIAVDAHHRLAPPSALHWLGTDRSGRDVLSRTISGARVSLTIIVATLLVTAPIGMAVGCTAGYLGGAIGAVLMRVTDIFLALPSLVLAMALVAALGPGLANTIIAIAIASWPVLARLTCAETMRIRSSDFISAIRIQGASPFRIILRHVMPLCLPIATVRLSLGVANTVLTAAALGFLGLGAQPPTPEWGVLLAEGRPFMAHAWWTMAGPTAAIVLVSISFNLLGDGLRDLFDTRLI